MKTAGRFRFFEFHESSGAQSWMGRKLVAGTFLLLSCWRCYTPFKVKEVSRVSWASGILKDGVDPSGTKRSQKGLMYPCIVHVVELLFHLWSQTFSTRHAISGLFNFSLALKPFIQTWHPISNFFFIPDWPVYRSDFPILAPPQWIDPLYPFNHLFFYKPWHPRKIPCGPSV